MHFTAAKSLTIALILFLGIMQLLLPFIHTHYDGDFSHGDHHVQLLHVHSVEMAQYQVDLYDDARSMSADTESNILSVDHAIPSKKQLGKMFFLVIFCMATIISYALLVIVKYVPTSHDLKRDFINRQAPPRAPPLS